MRFGNSLPRVSLFAGLLTISLVCLQTHRAASDEIKPDVPTRAVKRRTLVVANDGSGQFRSIQAALDASQPGDTIQVKNGVYHESPTFTRSGTKALPITLASYPGHHPIIVPAPTYEHAVIFRAQWIIVDGFEIRQGYNGVIIYQGHNTIRRCYIHNNGDLSDTKVTSGQGILLVSCKDVLITENRIERNGLRNANPFQVHGIYLSDFYHTGIAQITISKNVIREHGGGGFHAFMSSDLGSCRNILIENNLLENNAHEIICVHMSDSIIRNNAIRHGRYPATTSPDSSLFWFELSPRNVITHNSITATLSASNFFAIKSVTAEDTERFEANRWKLPDRTAWIWHGTAQTDFNRQFRLQTGQETHSADAAKTEPQK